MPRKYRPKADQTRGIRNNLAFESLTITPDRSSLFTATQKDGGLVVFDLSMSPMLVVASKADPTKKLRIPRQARFRVKVSTAHQVVS